MTALVRSRLPLAGATLLTAAAWLLSPTAQAQNVGIGTPTPNAKAALEISATDKGLLIPRMTQAQRTAITTPPQGLMVFQTDGTTGFWYYFGSSWVNIPNATTATQTLSLAGQTLSISGGNSVTLPSTATPSGTAGGVLAGSYPNPTLAASAVTNAAMADDAIGIAELSATGTPSSTTFLRGDNTWATPASSGWSLTGNSASATNFLGTTNNQDLIFQRNGAEAFRVKANGSVSLGNNTPSSLSVALGFNCGTTLSSGLQNVFIGGRCAEDNDNNLGTFVGYQSGQHSTGYGNTLLGGFAGNRISTGDNNTIVGSGAVGTGTAGIGSGNVVLGTGAGNTFSNNNNNILIGNSSDASASLYDGYAIGNNAFVTQSQSLVIGNVKGTNDAVSVGIGVQAPHSTLQVNGTFAVGVVTGFVGGGSTNANNLDQGRTHLTSTIGGYYALAPTSSANQYYRLPDASACTGRIYYLRNTSGSVAARFTSTGPIIDGSTTISSPSTFDMGTTGTSKVVTAISDGTNWIIMRGAN